MPFRKLKQSLRPDSAPRPFTRRIVGELLRAERCPSRPLPRVRAARQRFGLAYQRKVGTQLAAFAKDISGTLESEPWFSFIDEKGNGQAVPDFILTCDTTTVVIEIKSTFVPEAETKLFFLYCPIVRRILDDEGKPNLKVQPLIICRNLSPVFNRTHEIISLRQILQPTWPELGYAPVLHWLGKETFPF